MPVQPCDQEDAPYATTILTMLMCVSETYLLGAMNLWTCRLHAHRVCL